MIALYDDVEETIHYFDPRHNSMTPAMKKTGKITRQTMMSKYAKIWSKYLENKC